jgi:hypothetical protein
MAETISRIAESLAKGSAGTQLSLLHGQARSSTFNRGKSNVRPAIWNLQLGAYSVALRIAVRLQS